MPDSAAQLSVGDNAPIVILPRDGGEMVNMSDINGPVVLYFYPKDDTPGCTKEAIGFTQDLENFAASGATILGVSKDTVTKHEKFAAKHDLKIALLSDEAGDVCERYGTWVSKQMYGKTYMGIERSTYIIVNGKITHIWRKVKVPGHVEAVLDAVRAL